MTAIDNVYAYNAGQGEAPTRNVADLIAVMGADSGFLNLVGVPGTESIAGLAGRRVGVDALTTGYAFVLLRMLEQAGVGREDVDFVGSGGVMARFGALMNREFDATLLVSPFDAAATKQGFVHLGSGLEALGSYQGVVATVRRDWAAKNEAAVTGYIRAWRQAVAWLFDPANREAAIGLLLEEVPQMDPDVAAISYEVLLDPTTGFTATARSTWTAHAWRSNCAVPMARLTPGWGKSRTIWIPGIMPRAAGPDSPPSQRDKGDLRHQRHQRQNGEHGEEERERPDEDVADRHVLAVQRRLDHEA